MNEQQEALADTDEQRESPDFAIDREAFRRLVREVAQDFKADLKFQAAGVDAMQECAEAYLESMFEGMWFHLRDCILHLTCSRSEAEGNP